MKLSSRKEIFRIMDANFNRSREGLRVCEEIARFMLNSPALTKNLKSIRHDISSIIKSFPDGSKILLESRNSDEDVGRCSKLTSEMKRMDIADIFMANMERVKESLRVLEEFFKIVNIKGSGKLCVLRFRIYGAEKKAVNKINSMHYRGR